MQSAVVICVCVCVCVYVCVRVCVCVCVWCVCACTCVCACVHASRGAVCAFAHMQSINGHYCIFSVAIIQMRISV